MRLMLVLACVVAVGLPARTAEQPWVGATNSKLRLFGGMAKTADGEQPMAGIQLRMDDGWKTYWRNPGDSGVPPQFNWSGSTNLKEAKVLYPAPHRFADANSTAIGYSGEVIFPVKLIAERPGEPIELKLAFDFGLCKSLCIPNDAKLSLKLEPGATLNEADAKLLNAALDLVPQPVAPGALPAIGKIEAKLDADKPSIVIEALFPPGAARHRSLRRHCRWHLRARSQSAWSARRRQTELCGELRFKGRGEGHQRQDTGPDIGFGPRLA